MLESERTNRNKREHPEISAVLSLEDMKCICSNACQLPGQVLAQMQRHPLDKTSKGQGDFFTKADLRSQQMIVDYLSVACPDVPIIAEEGHQTGLLPSSYLAVDPLDGTIVYSRGQEHWGVCVSYIPLAV